MMYSAPYDDWTEKAAVNAGVPKLSFNTRKSAWAQQPRLALLTWNRHRRKRPGSFVCAFCPLCLGGVGEFPVWRFILPELSPFTPAVCHSPKYDSGVTSESRTGGTKTVDSSVWSKWDIWAPFRLAGRRRECDMVKKDAGDLLVRWVWGWRGGGPWGAAGQNPFSAAQAEILCLRSV